MSLPIVPTPYLEGEDARKFEKKLEEGLKKPVTPTPTPKLKKAKKLIKRYYFEARTPKNI